MEQTTKETTDLIGYAEWRGSVREALTSLKGTVAQLREESATKEDIKATCRKMDAVQEQMEKALSSLEKSVEKALTGLPCHTIASRVSESEKEIAKLGVAFKIKSSVWGLLGGIIPSAIVIAYMVIKAVA